MNEGPHPSTEMISHASAGVGELFVPVRALVEDFSYQRPRKARESRRAGPHDSGRLENVRFCYETFHTVHAVVQRCLHGKLQ